MYLAACDVRGPVAEVRNDKGLDVTEVFDFLLSLPRSALLVGFSLGYDFTKWVESLPDHTVYALTHPDERSAEFGVPPVRWRGYNVNRVSRRFSIALRDVKHSTRTVWDVWAFFQTSFVKALRKWEIGSKRAVDRIESMKAERAGFTRIGPKQRAYCREECMLLAQLVTALVKAHHEADLDLPHFYGPGSTASVMLARMKADEHNVHGPPSLRIAASRAFFGGRFETSRVGPVKGPLYAYDIASAYPYGWCLLPCMKHGKWSLVSGVRAERAIVRGKLVLARYRLDLDGREHAWGPLPFRTPRGNIIFPVKSAGGWVWSPELVQGRRLHGGIRVLGGYVYKRMCDCGHPFRKHMTGWYRERNKVGKGTRGIPFKLGLNSCNGKSMQTVGKARWRCLLRAGLAMSFVRARLLEAIACAKDERNVVELACDSILSREPLSLPPPVRLQCGKGQPLGSWEPKGVYEAVFLCRPGMRFCPGENAPLSDTAARGLGVSSLHAARGDILAAWKREPLAPFYVPQPRTFRGAKQSVRRKNRREHTFVRSAEYGQWVKVPDRVLRFTAEPKRSAVWPDFSLECWELPQGEEFESVAYEEAPESPEAMAVREYQEEEEDQG